MFFSPKELFAVCFLILKMLYSAVKSMVKAGYGWLVILICAIYFLTPALPESAQNRMVIISDLLLLVCIVWVFIRFIVRLVKRDKEWGSMRKVRRKRRDADVTEKDTKIS